MNFLAHFHLADLSDTSLTGAILGDIIKGDDWKSLSKEQQVGVLVHRRIDSLTDQHPAVIDLLCHFEHGQRRFAPIALDVFFDCMLSRFWSEFHHLPLTRFNEDVYQRLSITPPKHPRAIQLSQRIISQDWLNHYHDWQYCCQAIKHIERRFNRPVDLTATILTCNHLAKNIEDTFLTVYPDLLNDVRGFAKNLS